MAKRSFDHAMSEEVGSNTAKNLRESIAVQACDACRKKKARCDEDVPVCGTCRRSGSDCNYGIPRATKKDQTLLIAVNSIRRLEAKIEHLTEAVDSLKTISSGGETVHQVNAPTTNLAQETQPLQVSQKVISFSQHGALRWPAVIQLLPRPILDILNQLPKNYAVELERSRSPLPFESTSLSHATGRESLNKLPLHVIRGLIDAYFSTFNGPYPVLDRGHFFSRTLGQALDNEFDYSIESTTVLLVLALGQLAVEGHREGDYSLKKGHSADEGFVPPNWYSSLGTEQYPGLSLFNEARKRMGFCTGSTNLCNSQVYLLCAFYYTQIVRPMDSYVMLERAALCSKTTLTCSEPVDWSTWEGDMESRVFWCALMYETILTQELGLPKSGLSDFEAEVPLPTFRVFQVLDTEDRLASDSDDDDSFFHYHFLAQAANRIMLTRISNSHYFYGENSDLPSRRIHAELLHQIDTWRASLPNQLQFSSQPMSQRPANPGHAIAEALLRSRHKVILFHLGRPYLYKALHNPSRLTDDDLAACRATWIAAMDWPMLTGICKKMKSCMLLKFGFSSQAFGQLVMMWCFMNAPDHRLRETIPPEFAQWAHELFELLEYSAVFSPTIAKDVELLQCLPGLGLSGASLSYR